MSEQPIRDIATIKWPAETQKNRVKRARWKEQEKKREIAAADQQEKKPERVSQTTIDQMLREVRGEI